MAIDLSDYVEVSERIERFYEKHPEGSLQSRWETVELDGQHFVVCDASAYRTADDKRPGQGTAWEPFPGKTPYTKDSELMNAQTSAWGRAIAALGFEVKRGIASANEVRARSGSDNDDRPASDKQRTYVNRLLGQNGIKEEERLKVVQAVCGGDKLTSSGASQIIEACKDGKAETLLEVAGITGTDEPLPVDDEGLDDSDDTDRGSAESLPF